MEFSLGKNETFSAGLLWAHCGSVLRHMGEIENQYQTHSHMCGEDERGEKEKLFMNGKPRGVLMNFFLLWPRCAETHYFPQGSTLTVRMRVCVCVCLLCPCEGRESLLDEYIFVSGRDGFVAQLAARDQRCQTDVFWFGPRPKTFL